MNRTQKSEFVESLGQALQGAPLVVLADYRGATVEATNELRRALEKSGVTWRVVKNSLAKRALSGTDLEGLTEHCVGMTAVAISGDDPVGTAKLLKDALDPKGKIHVKAGFFDGELLDAAGVKAVASLPSREELLVSLLRTIQEPGRQVLGVLQAPARDLLFLLNNYQNKLAEGEAGE
jgi:large subunit ribosomal protein L10